jgi:probable phosphoglycerate mutase
MFIIVRHGNTFESGVRPRRIGARTDLCLTATGHEQARALGEHFAARSIRFDRVIVSPLARTRQTAEAILEAQIDPPWPELAQFLREIDYGPDENAFEEKVLERLGKPALAAWEAHGEPPDGWIIEPGARIAQWRALFDEASNADRTTLLVTSNGAARFALLADEHLAAASRKLESLKLPTGGYGIIEYGSDGGLHLAQWGIRP